MATEATGEAGAAVGMPQLDPSTWPNQIFWLLVTLVVMYFVLSRIALPRIGAVLAERKGTITNDLAAAEELKLKAVQAEKAYNEHWPPPDEAAKIVAAAKVDIQKDLDAATARQIPKSPPERPSPKRPSPEFVRAQCCRQRVARDTAYELVAALGGASDATTVAAAVNARLKG